MRRGDGKEMWRGWIPVRLAAAGLAAAALTAACGTVPAPGETAHVTDHQGGPPWNDRAGALVIARNVLSNISLPAGSVRLPQHPLPPGLHKPGSSMAATHYVDRYRLYRLPMPMGAALAYLRSHSPAGMTLEASGSSGNRSGIIERDLMFAPKHEPFGISALALDETIVRGQHGHALMRADAEVIWFPRRSAAEHLNPADYRSVRVVAHVYGAKLRTIARTFSTRGAIERLTRLLNGLPASPGEAIFCPASFITVRVAFAPKAGHPAAVVSSSGCPSDSIAVGGKQQPALNDFGHLVGLVRKLLHLPSQLVPTARS